MNTPDILVIGGGIAGLSAASALAAHARVTVLEAEEAIGFHSTGRSATMVHYALGDPHVRELTLASRPFFDLPPQDFSDAPLGRATPVLIHARRDEVATLEKLHAAIEPFADLERLDEEGMIALCPVLRIGEGGAVAGFADHDGIRLDPHALLQGHARRLRRCGGEIVTNARIASLTRVGSSWQLTPERGETFSAPILVNAGGSWADQIALFAGLGGIGLMPLQRTIITFDGPVSVDTGDLPFTKTVTDELYFAPESGRLLASPMDEVPSDPCDAQPGEYEVALASHRVEERTTIPVHRIHSRWAGLRTFAPDRHLVAGFDPRADGFFWLAGQGGFGLQTSPIMAEITASVIVGRPWPIATVSAEELSPSRFLG